MQQKKKEELVKPDGDELINRVEESNSLFSSVTQPREAVLDSEFLCLVSQFGVEKNSKASIKLQNIYPSRFCGKIEKLYRSIRISKRWRRKC